jgi:lipopolysaccharide transport system permease protein
MGNARLISKVYFSRLIMPISTAVAPLGGFAIAFVVLVRMTASYGVALTWGMFALPLFLFLALLTALSVCLWLLAFNVRYRNVRHAIPFLMDGRLACRLTVEEDL